MRELSGKTALVTGASRGIGVHVARALADCGANLVLVARSADELARIKTDLAQKGVDVQCIAADLTSRQGVSDLAARATELTGGIDVLINNAGADQCALYSEVSSAEIARIIELNLTAPMLLTRLLLPGMLARGAGHVVNIASVAGLMGVAYNEAYAASKHGMLGFTRSLTATAEGEGWPLGFSCILPGFVTDVGMYQQMQQHAGGSAPVTGGTTSPERVARATVTAIRRRQLEVIVSPRPFRLLASLLLWFPWATGWALRATGSIAWFRAVARGRRQEVQKPDS